MKQIQDDKKEFLEIVESIKEFESPKKTTPLIEVFEQCVRVVSAINRNDKRQTIENLCSLFVICIKNNEFHEGDYSYINMLRGSETTDEIIAVFRSKIGDFLRNPNGGVSFILGIIEGLGYAPFECIKEYIKDGTISAPIIKMPENRKQNRI